MKSFGVAKLEKIALEYSSIFRAMAGGIFLLLGSNLGDRIDNLNRSLRFIESDLGRLIRQSSIYSTEAWGVTDQPEFLNQVVEIDTKLAPELLLKGIKRIESAIGRQRRERWGPREIDIDILLYGSVIVSTDQLQIPHRGLPHRRFALVPLAEIAPSSIHPVFDKTIADLLKVCTDPLVVRRHLLT